MHQWLSEVFQEIRFLVLFGILCGGGFAALQYRYKIPEWLVFAGIAFCSLIMVIIWERRNKKA